MSKVFSLTSSRPAIHLAMFLAKHLPPKAGAYLARVIAITLVRLGGSLPRAVRMNQAQIRGWEPNDPRLTRVIQDVLVHAGQTYYDLFHQITTDRPIPISVTETSWDNWQRATSSGHGIIVAAPHLSNFDLGIQYLASRGIKMQILSLREPRPGFQLLNRLRAGPHCQVTPISPSALREAIRRLEAGGIVGTGIDRPIPDQSEKIEFFGRPARLPIGHIRLALRTNAIIEVMWVEWDARVGYTLQITPPLHIERTGNAQTDISHNSRRVLAIVENAILCHPEQWLAFAPVWE